ncbi:proteasome subunit beta [Candidatus Pacearchaeota archaeon]|jgi:proteasome beta subunit|nr:proteasome subunit beta [Candidatus Pacearchaeota archaeon]|tara:strand:- start:8566 stop:9222 length:657 start_codon:yes stop_codon:yes gene_type:complete
MDAELKNSILKTGTTILGIVCKDGVIMAADKQSTAGNIVMNKDSEKIKQVNNYLLFAGTGMVSDIQRSVKLSAAELRLKELKSRVRPTIKQGANLISSIIYQSIRQPTMLQFMVGSLVSGINEDGTIEVYSIDPSGGIKKIEDYDANFGSGMPYVLGLLERQYKKGMNVKEGVELAKEALKSATQRDVGSGYGIDIFTITKDGIKKVVEQEIIPEYKG